MPKRQGPCTYRERDPNIILEEFLLKRKVSLVSCELLSIIEMNFRNVHKSKNCALRVIVECEVWTVEDEPI